MKTAIFTDGFLPSFGGAEKATERFAVALSKTAEVIVFAPDNSKPYDDSAYPFKVVRVKSLPATKNDRFAMPFLDKKVKKILDNFKPDVIH
ncbi:MAG: glycosyltransferase, partial [Clostridia bacterium]|nr:glycosyltransferase [Clostridia bacterium]